MKGKRNKIKIKREEGKLEELSHVFTVNANNSSMSNHAQI
jgi:hypothetical protein